MIAKKGFAGVNEQVQFYDIIKSYKDTYYSGVPVSLVLAHIEAESYFDPNAYRAEPQIKDASYGLMQLLFQTAWWLGFRGEKDELYNPQTNIFYGMKYINHLMEKFPGNPEGYIMSYNEGEGNYQKGKRVPTYFQRVSKFREKWISILAQKGLSD